MSGGHCCVRVYRSGLGVVFCLFFVVVVVVCCLIVDFIQKVCDLSHVTGRPFY